MKERSRPRTLGGCAALIVGTLLFISHHVSLDGIHGWFFSRTVLGGEDTEYSPGYKDRAFRAVRIGMSRDKVLELLGAPIETGEIPEEALEILRYARSPSDKSYRVRVIQIRNSVVVAKISEFYID